MDRPLRIGLSGVGNWGEKILNALNDVDHAYFKGACDPARKYAHYSYGEMIRDPAVDAVIIASPPAYHFSQSIMALDAGKHVFCEKPISDTPAGAQAVVALAQAKNLTFAPGFITLYDRGIRGLYRLLEHDEPGPGFYMSRFGGRANPATTVIRDLATHDIASFLWLTGTRLPGATAHAEYLNDKQSAMGLVETRDVTLTFDVGWQEQKIQATRVRAGDDSYWVQDDAVHTDDGVWREKLPEMDPLRSELQKFVDCCRAGLPHPHVDLVVPVMQVIAALEDSAENGGEERRIM